jgi:hypothetical protein
MGEDPPSDGELFSEPDILLPGDAEARKEYMASSPYARP